MNKSASQLDGWMAGWLAGWLAGWMDGWMKPYEYWDNSITSGSPLQWLSSSQWCDATAREALCESHPEGLLVLLVFPPPLWDTLKGRTFSPKMDAHVPFPKVGPLPGSIFFNFGGVKHHFDHKASSPFLGDVLCGDSAPGTFRTPERGDPRIH